MNTATKFNQETLTVDFTIFGKKRSICIHDVAEELTLKTFLFFSKEAIPASHESQKVFTKKTFIEAWVKFPIAE